MDRRRAPRRHVGARRAPELAAVAGVEGAEERALLDVDLDDDDAVVQDRRAARLPLRRRIAEPAGVEDAQVLLPQQLALEIVGVEALGAEERDQPLAVGDQRRVGV
jgi:hypothetical protein